MKPKSLRIYVQLAVRMVGRLWLRGKSKNRSGRGGRVGRAALLDSSDKSNQDPIIKALEWEFYCARGQGLEHHAPRKRSDFESTKPERPSDAAATKLSTTSRAPPFPGGPKKRAMMATSQSANSNLTLQQKHSSPP
jgi:hypothetical protein